MPTYFEHAVRPARDSDHATSLAMPDLVRCRLRMQMTMKKARVARRLAFNV